MDVTPDIVCKHDKWTNIYHSRLDFKKRVCIFLFRKKYNFVIWWKSYMEMDCLTLNLSIDILILKTNIKFMYLKHTLYFNL